MITNIISFSKVFIFDIEFQASEMKAEKEFDKLIQEWYSILDPNGNKFKLMGEKVGFTSSTHFYRIHLTVFKEKYRDIYDESIDKTIERLNILMEQYEG